MKKRSDSSKDWDDLRARIIGLGERSIRKSYYPELEQRLIELERFRALLDQSNDLIFLVQIPSGHFADVNESACRQLGLSREAILGMSIRDLVPASVFENMATLFAEKAQTDRVGITLVTTFHGSEREIPVELSVRLDTFKDAVYAVIVARDIIERKEAEAEHRVHLWFFESLDLVNRAMQGTNDLEQMMKDVLDGLLSIFGCDRARLVYPCDPEAATWQVPMERTRPEYPGVLPIGVELPLEPAGAEVYRILRDSTGPVTFSLESKHPVPLEIAGAYSVQSFIAMAIYPKIGKPWSFGLHQCSYARIWTPEEQRLFQEIGRRLSDTLSTLLAYRNLQKSERQIKQLIDASPVAMVVSWGAEERVEWISDKFIELFGYTIEDMPDVEHWWPLAYPDETYRAEIKAQWEADVEQARREKGQIKPMEAIVRCKDGSRRHIEFRFSSIGERHLVTFVDLTERKQIEQQLVAREREYRVLVENIPDLIVRYDKNLRRIYVNPAWEKATGLSAKEVVHVPYTKIPTVPSSVDNEYLEKLQQVLRTGTTQTVEFSWQHTNGVTLVLEYVIIPEYDRDGNINSVLSVGHNITARKKTEAQLLASEQLFRALVENSPDFIARYDRDCRRIYVNPAIQKLFGTPSENMLGKTPADQSPVYTPQVFMDHLKRAVETGTESVTEMPFRTTEGEMHWSHMRFVPEFGPDGKVDSVLHIGRDIHEIKENERRFRMLAENFPDFVMRFDRNGRFLYVNPAFAEAFGAPAESIIGKVLGELPQRGNTEQYDAALVLIRRAFDEGIANETEVRWHTETGERIFETRYVPEKDATGNIVTILCTARDVTKQKRAEEELQKSNDLLRAVIEAAPIAIIGLDLEGRVQHAWNPAAEKMLGWRAEEVMGQYLPSGPIDKEDEFQKFRQWISRGQGMDGVEVQQRRRDGTPIDYSIYASPLHDAQGRITGNIAVLVDITERKRAEEQRKNHLRFLESMDQVNRALQSANDLEWIMTDVLDLVLSIFECDRAYLGYPCDPETPSWSLRAESTRPEYTGLLALGVDDVPVDAGAVETFRILLNTDGPATFGPGNSYPLPANATERFGLKSFMSMAFHPKVDRPWQFGIHQCSYGRIWTSEDKRLFHEIGRRLSDVLTVLLTYRHLQDSEDRYRQLVSLSPDAIAIYSQGQIVFANPATVKMVGANSEKGLIGRPILDFIHPDFQKYVMEHMKDMLATGESIPFMEEKFLRLDGLVVDVEVAVVSYQREGVDHMQIVARDITERKRHEREREAIITVSTALRQVTTSTDILNIILDQLIHLFKADGAVMVLPDPQTGGLIDEIGRGPVGERMIGLNIPPERGVANWVIKNKKPYLNNHADQDSLFYRTDLLADSHCLAAVPLIAQEQAIGALWIARQVDILEQDVRLLTAIADIAANAIHRVILHEQTEQQLHHLMALHQIDLAISANFDLNVTLNVILKHVKDELGVDAASILSMNPVTHTLVYAAGIGFRTRRIEQSNVRLGQGCAGRAAQEYQTISCVKLDRSPEMFSRSSLLAAEEFVSHYATPLVVKGKVKGVLEVFHRKIFESEPEWIDYFETLATQAAIAIESTSLFENLQRSNMELMMAYDATIEGWSRALDLRDRETEGHTQRVTDMVLDLAEKMGMSDAEKMDLKRGALLHDIGKMGVPDSILLKAGSLSESEWEIMRQHPFYAFQMLSPIPYLKHALDIPYCHHEKWDGSGYPRGLKGEEIPLSARLFAVVDVFDALTSNRPYRVSWPLDEVYRYIQEQAGKQFDPKIVKIFLENKR